VSCQANGSLRCALFHLTRHRSPGPWKLCVQSEPCKRATSCGTDFSCGGVAVWERIHSRFFLPFALSQIAESAVTHATQCGMHVGNSSAGCSHWLALCLADKHPTRIPPSSFANLVPRQSELAAAILVLYRRDRPCSNMRGEGNGKGIRAVGAHAILMSRLKSLQQLDSIPVKRRSLS
jgi:hypothetical protein